MDVHILRTLCDVAGVSPRVRDRDAAARLRCLRVPRRGPRSSPNRASVRDSVPRARARCAGFDVLPRRRRRDAACDRASGVAGCAMPCGRCGGRGCWVRNYYRECIVDPPPWWR